MNKELKVFLEDNAEDIIITGGVDSESISVVENALGMELNDSYKEYLQDYGIILGFGVELTGCGKSGNSTVVKETLRNRKYGLGKEYIVIRNADEWVYCLHNTSGEISSWDRTSREHRLVSGSFYEYILEELTEAMEDW